MTNHPDLSLPGATESRWLPQVPVREIWYETVLNGERCAGDALIRNLGGPNMPGAGLTPQARSTRVLLRLSELCGLTSQSYSALPSGVCRPLGMSRHPAALRARAQSGRQACLEPLPLAPGCDGCAGAALLSAE